MGVFSSATVVVVTSKALVVGAVEVDVVSTSVGTTVSSVVVGALTTFSVSEVELVTAGVGDVVVSSG